MERLSRRATNSRASNQVTGAGSPAKFRETKSVIGGKRVHLNQSLSSSSGSVSETRTEMNQRCTRSMVRRPQSTTQKKAPGTGHLTKKLRSSTPGTRYKLSRLAPATCVSAPRLPTKTPADKEVVSDPLPEMRGSVCLVPYDFFSVLQRNMQEVLPIFTRKTPVNGNYVLKLEEIEHLQMLLDLLRRLLLPSLTSQPLVSDVATKEKGVVAHLSDCTCRSCALFGPDCRPSSVDIPELLEEARKEKSDQHLSKMSKSDLLRAVRLPDGRATPPLQQSELD